MSEQLKAQVIAYNKNVNQVNWLIENNQLTKLERFEMLVKLRVTKLMINIISKIEK